MTAPATLEEALRATNLGLRYDRVILFGSRTQGRATPASDWDLLVVDPRTGKRLASAPGVEIVTVDDIRWGSDTFLGTELAACLAFYGVPLSEPLPDRDRIRFDDVRDGARRTAARFWSNGLKRIGLPRQTEAIEMYRRKAATSSLLAERYYAAGKACPARIVLVEEWAAVAPEERRTIMEAAGIKFDRASSPPPSIAKCWGRG